MRARRKAADKRRATTRSKRRGYQDFGPASAPLHGNEAVVTTQGGGLATDVMRAVADQLPPRVDRFWKVSKD